MCVCKRAPVRQTHTKALGIYTKSLSNCFSGGLPKNKNKKNSSCEFLLLFAFCGIKTYRKTINKKSIGVYSTVQVIRGISLKMIKIIIFGQSETVYLCAFYHFLGGSKVSLTFLKIYLALSICSSYSIA